MSDEELRQLAERLERDADHLAFDSQKFDVALYRDAAGNARAASAAILSLMSERDEANARALNWECRFEAASARGAAAEARIRELSLSELTALGQADENHKRALDAEARLEKAKEALREIFEDTDAVGMSGGLGKCRFEGIDSLDESDKRACVVLRL